MAHHTQGSMLDILKKKMRQAKEEMENARDSAEEAEKRHALEIKRREDVRGTPFPFLVSFFISCKLKFIEKIGRKRQKVERKNGFPGWNELGLNLDWINRRLIDRLGPKQVHVSLDWLLDCMSTDFCSLDRVVYRLIVWKVEFF